MIIKYIWVFISAFLDDVIPLPLPPACVVMIFFQMYFKLDTWTVICVGVAGSILGRYTLMLYIRKVAGRIFNPSKNEDVQFLGEKMKEKGWKTQLSIVSYSLLPLPTTPLFIAGGMAKMKHILILPAFFVGKFTSDALAVFAGEYAAENTSSLLKGIVSWQSVMGFVIGLVLIGALLFVDWRTWLREKKFTLNFKIWK